MLRAKYVFLLIFTTSFITLNGQQSIVDKLDLANSLYSEGKVEPAIKLFEDAFYQAKRENNKYQMVKAKGYLGWVGIQIGDYASAQVNTSDALEYLRKLDTVDLYHETAYLEYLAIINAKYGDHRRASQLYEATYRSAQRYISEEREAAVAYGDTDWLYLLPLQRAKSLKKIGEYDEAGTILLAVLEESELENDDSALAEVLNQLGILKIDNEEYLKAQDFFGRVAFTEDSINEVTRAAAYHNLGKAYFEQNDINKAEEYYSKALEIKEEINAQPDKLFITMQDLGEVYLKKEDYSSAVNIWIDAMAVYGEFEKNPDAFKIYDLLGKAYSKIDEEKASEYSAMYVTSMSSWIEEQTNKNPNAELAIFNTRVDNIIASRSAQARRIRDVKRYWPFAAMALVVLALLVYQMQIVLNKRRDRVFENRLKTDRALKADEILKQIRRD